MIKFKPGDVVKSDGKPNNIQPHYGVVEGDDEDHGYIKIWWRFVDTHRYPGEWFGPSRTREDALYNPSGAEGDKIIAEFTAWRLTQ
jgi:hypothetical protein